jgi:Family of unknown function (DUF6526)
MKRQEYSNHVKYYTPHHFIFYPLAVALLFIVGRRGWNDPANRWEWVCIGGAVVLVTWLSFMTRQHYAITGQNRIVRLELRFRYFVLTRQRLEPLESKLSFAQLAALRFASDEELPALVDRAIAENISADEIKKSIKNWLPDMMRV